MNQDVRLNHRVIDIRTTANQGIFRIQSGVCRLFREFLLSQARSRRDCAEITAEITAGITVEIAAEITAEITAESTAERVQPG